MLPYAAPKKVDPFTGLPIEDDIDVAPNTGAEVLNQTADAGGGGGGGAAPAAPAAVPVFPPKPVWEKTVSSSGKVESQASRDAERDLQLSQGKVDTAQEQVNDVTQQEAQVAAPFAQQAAESRRESMAAAKAVEDARRKYVEDAQREDDANIEEVKQAKIKAGEARKNFWAGNTAGFVLQHVLRGIGAGAAAWRKESGPTAVDKVFEEKLDAHEKALVGAYEATKEAQQLKKANNEAFLAELEKRRIFAANQSIASIDLIESELKAALAGLSPEKQKAAAALVQAAAEEARAKAKATRAAAYERTTEFRKTNRSETGSGSTPRGQGLSAEGMEAADASAAYDRMAAEQEAMVKKHKGFPLPGTPDAARFQNNETAMAAALQKQYGKSDNDAKLAEKTQGTPSTAAQIASQLPGVKELPIANPVNNYLATLNANRDRMKATANTRIAIENKAGGAAASAVVNTKKAPAKSDDITTWSDAEVRAAYNAAVKAQDQAGVSFGLREMKRRGLNGGK